MIRLEVAFDDVSTERCLEIVQNCKDDIDIIEVGTLLVIREGLRPLRLLRELYPDKTLLVDPKIMDAPEKIATACYEAGADIVTVMSAAGRKVIEKVLDVAKRCGKQVFVDLLGSSDLVRDAILFDELGADYICVHTSTESSQGPLADLMKVNKAVTHANVAAACGINMNTVSSFRPADPDLLVVGSGIYTADDPKEAIRVLKEKYDEIQ